MKEDEKIGSKARVLDELIRLGCRVPPFIVLSSDQILPLASEGLGEVLEKRIGNLNISRYAVRSAALIEDQANTSLAGQFKTILDVPFEGLAQALREVIEQATEYLKGDLSRFSCIIQEFIEPDLAGVLFTRHPEGKLQMLLEYHEGRGEELVSGRIQPKSLEVLWTSTEPRRELPGLFEAIEQAKKIERHFAHPQDIEWCIKDGTWFFLQARPITTITSEQYQGLKYLDEVLPNNGPFFYQQTEISEICPRPVPFMQSLLSMIYAKNGPLEHVYQSYGVRYEARDFLRLIGNQLYIDREEEIKTLFPNYTYLAPHSLGKPSMSGLKGFFISVRQQGALRKLETGEIDSLERQLIQALSKRPSTTLPFKERLSLFLEKYKLIFEINLLAEQAVKLAQQLDPTFSLEPAAESQDLAQEDRALWMNMARTWKGNSLDMADERPFIGTVICRPCVSEDPAHTSKLHPLIQHALRLTRLREQGRWLTVKETNELRQTLFVVRRPASLVDPNLLYFATIDEVVENRIDPTVCSERRSSYHSFDRFSFSSELTSFSRPISANELVCLSKGTAEGRLVTKDQIEEVKGQKILYTEILTPDLVQYFDQIQGILSKRGGILSHLAILARERGMPVLSNVDLRQHGIRLGQVIKMDAEASCLEKARQA